MNESPPRIGAARLGNPAGAGSSKTKKTASRLPVPVPPVKKLLAHQDPVWLFEVREGGRVSYIVERKELWWRYGLFLQAQAKFDRQVQKHSRKREGSPTRGASNGDQ
jgi:hypothetical protein